MPAAMLHTHEPMPASTIVFNQSDVLESILSWLSPTELLECASVCSLFCETADALLTRDGVLELSKADAAHHATDGLLLFLAKQRIPRAIRKLDIAGCGGLTKHAVWRAARASPKLQTLVATKVGGASWTLLELQRLIEACPSLRYLHVDCKSHGITNELLDLLQHPMTAIEKLTIHRAKPASEASGLAAPLTPGGDGGRRSFEKALQRCPSLKELDASGDCLEAVDGVHQISQALASSEVNLQSLKMASVPSMRRDIGLLADGLASNTKLEALELGCNFIGAAGVQQLASALAGHPTLRHLELSHNPLLDGVTALGDALAHNRSLTKLSMPFTGMNDDSCDALARALSQGSTVAQLDLSGNRITAEGMAVLAKGLAGFSAHSSRAGSPRCRRAARPADAAVTDSTLTSLTLTANTTLTSLNLTANHNIGGDGALLISAALPHCNIRSLSLAGCRIGASPCGRLVANLMRSQVESLDLSSNAIEDEGAWELAWGLPECPIKELRLAVNEIEDDGAAELLFALKAHPCLTTLDLRGNRIDLETDIATALSSYSGVNMSFQSPPRK